MESEPELCDLMNKVAAKCLNKWWEVGIQLGLTTAELENFRNMYGGNSNRCFTVVFDYWKKRKRNCNYTT